MFIVSLNNGIIFFLKLKLNIISLQKKGNNNSFYMILIADSGSTKTEWVLISNNEKVKEYRSIGLNPVFINTRTVISTINTLELIEYNKKIRNVFFYGAGCSTPTRNKIIIEALEECFNNATISVQSDLLGAAVSQFGNKNGIIGILGTGSNTGIYSKGIITNNIKSLGYILGDEGSGASIGKAFLNLLLNNELPIEIKTDFELEYELSLNNIITKTYKEKFPNRFLASFMPFLAFHKKNEAINMLLFNNFNDFFEKTIVKYPNYNNLELKLTGSVAFYFSDIIEQICTIKGINLVEINKTPTQGLIKFHSN